MKYITSETVPLTDDEKEWLLYIYTKKKKNLKILFGGNFLGLIFVTFTRIGYIISIVISSVFTGGRAQNYLPFSWWYLKLAVDLALAALFTRLAYQNSMLPYKLDAESGVKRRAGFTITRKQFFPVTDQYFVWLKGGPRNNYEVARDKFDNCEEGGLLYMDQAIKSKYIFSEDDQFKVL